MSTSDVMTPTDAELLTQFIGNRDEATFRELVQRHGSLVMGICRQILRHQHDADDAFQATFIVLALRAKTLRKSSSLASWLYRVAYRTSMRAAKQRQLRSTEFVGEDVAVTDDPLEKIHAQSLQKVLHEELSQLPESYRAPLVLCYLEQRTRQEAATQLESTEAAVKARLARGKRMLRLRLARRGVALSVVIGITAPEISEASPIAEDLVHHTVEACQSAAASGGLPPDCSPDLLVLVKQGTQAMIYSSFLKSATAICATTIVLSTFFLHADDPELGGRPNGQGTINLDNVLAQADGISSVRLAQANPNGVLSVGGEANYTPFGMQTTNDLNARRVYLMERAAAFEKIARSWQQRQPASGSLRLEYEGKADLYMAEVRRLRTAAKSLNSRRQQSQQTPAATRFPSSSDSTASNPEADYLETVSNFRSSSNSRTAASVDAAPSRPLSLPCCRENNLAFEAKVNASSEEVQRGNLASHATDGDLATRWCADGGGGNEWILVDLGRRQPVNVLRIHWEAKNSAYQYEIRTSPDGRNWRLAVQQDQNRKPDHMNVHRLQNTDVRFIRIEVHGNRSGYWASIREVEVSDSELSPKPVKAWEQIRVPTLMVADTNSTESSVAHGSSDLFSDNGTDESFSEDASLFDGAPSADASEDLFDATPSDDAAEPSAADGLE